MLQTKHNFLEYIVNKYIQSDLKIKTAKQKSLNTTQNISNKSPKQTSPKAQW